MGVEEQFDMDDRKKIEERLRKKEAEIQGLEERLRTAKIYVQALQDVLRLLGTPDSHPEPDAHAANKTTTLRSGSAVDQARQIILHRREPMHISALLEAMGKDASADSRVSLASSLAAYVRRGEIFSRPAPNTFGLLELGHSGDAESEDAQPPPGFGKINPIAKEHVIPPSPVDDDIPF
jgi:hypothetical protein